MVSSKTFTASNLNDFVDAFQPFTVGMDRMLRDMYSLNSRGPSGGYPPYNIVTVDDEHFVIEMAVAGFGEDEIEVYLLRTEEVNKKKAEEYILRSEHLMAKGSSGGRKGVWLDKILKVENVLDWCDYYFDQYNLSLLPH